jgi:hypothetical protein
LEAASGFASSFMEGKMKPKLAALCLLAAVLAPGSAFAGWGAIACDMRGSGACSTSSGMPTHYGAERVAMGRCMARGYDCYPWGWEHNMCKYGPNGSYACN